MRGEPTSHGFHSTACGVLPPPVATFRDPLLRGQDEVASEGDANLVVRRPAHRQTCPTLRRTCRPPVIGINRTDNAARPARIYYFSFLDRIYQMFYQFFLSIDHACNEGLEVFLGKERIGRRQYNLHRRVP